ncbi:unnamed protein product [Pylaiella littoralis]
MSSTRWRSTFRGDETGVGRKFLRRVILPRRTSGASSTQPDSIASRAAVSAMKSADSLLTLGGSPIKPSSSSPTMGSSKMASSSPSTAAPSGRAVMERRSATTAESLVRNGALPRAAAAAAAPLSAVSLRLPLFCGRSFGVRVWTCVPASHQT